MIATDEDALICDFAEYYHILNWRELPAKLAATLAVGLTPESRIKQAITGAKAPTSLILQAAILDRLSLLVWLNSADGQKGRNRPKSLAGELVAQPTSPVVAFTSGDAWQASRNRILRESRGDLHGE